MNNQERRLYREIYGGLMSKQVREIQQKKAESGQISGNCPIGYKWVHHGSRRRGSKTLEIDPEKAPMIKDAFQFYATNLYSIDDLRIKIEEKYNIKLTKSYFHVVLKNEFYIGIMTYSGKKYPHYYPQFIDKELFDKCQEVSQLKRKLPRKKTKLFTANYKGLLQCKECGCAITAELTKKIYVYYHCTFYKYRHKMKWLREELINEQMQRIVDKVYENKEVEKVIPYPKINWKKPDHTVLRPFLNQLFKKFWVLPDSTFEYEAWDINLVKERLIPKEEKPIVYANTIEQNIHIICRIPQDIDSIALLLKKDISEIQLALSDMQINGLVDQTLDGSWISL